VLIIVPSSETKRPPALDGQPVDLQALSFPELTPIRRRVLDAMIATSAGPDAFRRLHVTPTKAMEVARNTGITEVPAMAAAELYTGPLHQGLEVAGLSAAARERAEEAVVLTSALWGLLRLADRIPPYRLSIFSHLIGLQRLDAEWRQVLPDVLASAAGSRGAIVDLRTPENQTYGRPSDLGHRTVTLRVSQHRMGRRIGDVVAKRVRGQAARYLLESGVEPSGPEELAALFGERWPVRLSDPPGPRGSWSLTLIADD
jgi:uncharacterized protein